MERKSIDHILFSLVCLIWAQDACVKVSGTSHLYQTHAQKSTVSFLMSGTSHCRLLVQRSYCYRTGCLSWRRDLWICKAVRYRQRLGLHNSHLYLNTSPSRWPASLSQHMSRVRNTLDTVSKAVSGTHTELLSKINRLKPNALKAGKKDSEADFESPVKAAEGGVTPSSNAAAPCSSSAPPSEPTGDSSLPSPSVPTSAAGFDPGASTSTPPQTPSQAAGTVTSLTVRGHKEIKVRHLVPTVKASFTEKQDEIKASLSDVEGKHPTLKQNTALSHPSTLSVNLDETYNYLANHINSYFSSTTKTQDEKVENGDSCSALSKSGELTLVPDKPESAAAAVTPTATKKGLGHYLSYSAPTVQAFVGSYIAPLVPKFRTQESKNAALNEKKSENAAVKQTEATGSKELKTAEEKAKKLLLQQEKVRQKKHIYF